MVDYTDFEEKDCERKKEKCMFSPLHHHHLRPTTERRTIKKNFRGGGFLNFIKQNYTERRKTERKKEFKLTLDHHRASTTERRKIFFFLIIIIIIFRGAFKFHIISVCHNEFCFFC